MKKKKYWVEKCPSWMDSYGRWGVAYKDYSGEEMYIAVCEIKSDAVLICKRRNGLKKGTQ